MITIDVNDFALWCKAAMIVVAAVVALFAWFVGMKKRGKVKMALSCFAIFIFLSIAGWVFVDIGMEKSLKHLPPEYVTSDKTKLLLPKI